MEDTWQNGHGPALVADMVKVQAITQVLAKPERQTDTFVQWVFRFVYATDTPTQKGKIYFIAAEGTHLIKVGRSLNPGRRLMQLRLLSPAPLKIIGIINGGADVEVLLHENFDYLRSHGEWFLASKELREFIRVVSLPESGWGS